MNENWERVQSLFLQAVELRPEERGDFLKRACVDEEGLRREIESLLVHDGAPEQHITEALEGIAHSLFEGGTLNLGTKIGDYEVHKLIGSGGMGEVYQARDMRLGRDVAIKVLPSFLSNDPDRLRRFEQEARAAAAPNHPNILAVYQMGLYEGAPYLVSELLEGSTLRDVMNRGSLPLRSAIEYALQITRGLTAAHGKGIVHRDLKPENIFVTNDGHVKILDFGLAKLTDPTNSVRPGPVTEAGLVMGTVGYMSPEQVRGEVVDYRTDLFAVGTILYEMLTGQRAFQRPTAADTMSAILNEDPPDISQLLFNTPASLPRIIRRCLEKNREQRFQSAPVLAFALEAVSDLGIGKASGRLTRKGWYSRIWALGSKKAGFRYRTAVIAIFTCAVVLGVAYRFRPATPVPQVSSVVRLTRLGSARRAPIFPDGPRVYYQASGPLGTDWQVRQLLVNGDEDTPASIAAGKSFIHGLSPDGSEFLALSDWRGQTPVWRVPVAGGSPRRIGDLIANDISWSHDGEWLAYAKGDQLFLARPDGTSSRVVVSLPGPSTEIDQVRWSPDDRKVRFTLNRGGPGGSVRDPAKQSLWEVRTDGSGLRELQFSWPGVPMECCGEWTVDGGYFVFKSEREGISKLWMLQEHSDWWHRADRDPIQLTSGPINYYQPVPSRDGKTIFAIGVQPLGELVRYDRNRQEFVTFLGGRSFAHLSYSHDGKWLAYVAYPDGTLWRARSDGSDPLQLSSPPLRVGSPRWSPDDKEIAFHAIQPGQPWKSFVISAEGGIPEPFPSEPISQGSPDWMPGKNALIYSRSYGAEDPALYLFDRQSGRSQRVDGTNGLYGALWSPDGRYLCAVDAPGDRLLLVDVNSGKRTQIADRPVSWPTWSPDSQYIYFVRVGFDWIFRVHVPDGREEKILQIPFREAYWSFQLAPDGSLILLREQGRYDVYALSLSPR